MVLNIGNLLNDIDNNTTIIDTIVDVDSGIYYVLITPTNFDDCTHINALENLFGTGFYLIGGGGGGSGAKSSGGGSYCSNVPSEEKGSDNKSNGGGGGGGGQLGVVFNDTTIGNYLFVNKNSYIQITKGSGGNFGTGQGGGGIETCAGEGSNGLTSSINITGNTTLSTELYASGGNGGRLRTNKYNNGGTGGSASYNITGSNIPTTSYNITAKGGKANTEARAEPNDGTDIEYYNHLPLILSTYIDDNWITLNITHAKPGIYPNGITGDRDSSPPNTGDGGAGAAGKNGGKQSATDAGGGGFYSRHAKTFGRYVSPSGTSEYKYMSGNNAPWTGLSQQTFAGEGGGGGTSGSSGHNHQGGQGGHGSAFFWFTVKPPITPSSFTFPKSKPNRVLNHDETLSDPQDYSLTENISTSPNYGTYRFTPSTTTTGHYIVEYIPNENSLLGDLFEFNVQNVAGLDSASATATIQPFDTYEQPTSNDASHVAIGDVSYNFTIVAQYDTDIIEDIYHNNLSGASLDIISYPVNGNISVALPIIDLVNYTATFPIIYHSTSPYIGTDSFTFTVEDVSRTSITTNSGVSSQYTISLTVKDPAITYDISAYAIEDITSVIDLSGEDLDDNYPLKYFLDSYTSYGNLYDNNNDLLNITDSSFIGIQDTSANLPPIIKYTGNLNFNGWDQFTFFVQDKHNYVSNIGSIPSGIVDISVSPVNDAPVAYDLSQTYLANKGGNDFSYNIDLSASDIDNPPTDLTYYIDSLPPYGTLSYNGNPVTSVPFELTPIASNDISYTPVSTFVGITSFKYYVNDLEPLSSNIANVTIYLKPRTQDMTVNTIESTPVDIILNVTNTGQYSNYYQSVIKSYPQYGLLYDNNEELIEEGVFFNGITCTYIPTAYYYGNDSFNYEVVYENDTIQLTSNESTVDISINFVNNHPYLPDQTFNFYVKSDPQVFDISIAYFNYDGPDISDLITVKSLPNFKIYNQPIIYEWPGFIFDSSTSPLKIGDIIVNNNTPNFGIFEYFVDLKVFWPGNQYIGTSTFTLQAIDNSGNPPFTSDGLITLNFIYDKENGCDTGSGPIPSQLWSRDSIDCVDISGVGANDQPVTTNGYNLSEKRKATIFQYKNNSANFSRKQNYSRLARGLGRQRGQTFATQSDTYTDANTLNLNISNVTTGPLICNKPTVISGTTRQNNTPGPTMTISNYPNAPLYNYRVKRQYLAGNTKWPQTGPNIGDPRDPNINTNTRR